MASPDILHVWLYKTEQHERVSNMFLKDLEVDTSQADSVPLREPCQKDSPVLQ